MTRPLIPDDWAASHIECLAEGETVWFRPRGHSMAPRIHDGELVEVEPISLGAVFPGDIVLCRVRGLVLLHAVASIGDDGTLVIANAKGRVSGSTRTVYGRVVRVSP